MLALHLFGPPKLELEGDAVHIPRRKATALLAYLAVSGQSHSRDALATLLWPEHDQSSARTELRRTLLVLNRTLGKGWVCAGSNLSETREIKKVPGRRDIFRYPSPLRTVRANFPAHGSSISNAQLIRTRFSQQNYSGAYPDFLSLV